MKKNQKDTKYIQDAITYVQNQKKRMNYCSYLKKGFLIGSGVTESACKNLIKTRFCGSGMRWEENNVRPMTLMRGLVLTPNRWNQAWQVLAKSAA